MGITKQKDDVRVIEQGSDIPDDIGNYDFAARFEQLVRRKPTLHDSEVLIEAIRPTVTDITDKLATERADDFNVYIRKIAEANGVDPAKILEYMRKMGQEEQAYEAEIVARNKTREKRKKFLVKTGLTAVLGSALLGIGAGAGLGAYRAIHDPLLREKEAAIQERLDNEFLANTRAFDDDHKRFLEGVVRENDYLARSKRELEDQKKELEDKYFGPFDSLTKVTEPSALNVQTREAIVRKHLGLPPQIDLLYDKTVNGVRIKAGSFEIRDPDVERIGDWPSEEDIPLLTYWFITQYDPKTQGIASAHLYDGDPLDPRFRSYPRKAVRFQGKKVRLFDFEIGDGSNTPLRMTETKDGRITYSNGTQWEIARPYFDAALELEKEFDTLVNRGPNVPKEGK